MTTNNFFKRALAIFLTVLMLVLAVPSAVFATEDGASAEALSVGDIDKTATGLDDKDQTDVTLTVPGDFKGAIDVVLILGGGMQANKETVNSAINIFKAQMESGLATVRLGLISLERGQEIILDLNSDEAVLDPATYEQLITDKFEYISTKPEGSTNLHSQLLEAKRMLAEETEAEPENKYVFVLATGRTYWFDNAAGEQSTVVNKVNGTYYWGNYLWQSQRGRHTSLYMLPDRYNNSYEAFFADIEKWVAADGDTYVYTPHFDKNDESAYANWYAKNNKDLRALGLAGSRYGLGIVDPKPTADNFITGVEAAIGSETHPGNALNYERAQYESVQVYKELVAAGYNCYSICSENPNYQNNSEYITLGAKYTGTSRSQLGHSFMNYLATLGGQECAPTVWDYERDAEGNFLSANVVLKDNFFAPIADDILYCCDAGSTVEDYIGYNRPDQGNFEFIQDPATITMVRGDVTYTTTQIETKEGATASYEFAADGENSFFLDYYYGNGKDTEKFIWTFGDYTSMKVKASLTYKLQLTEKAEVAGTYKVDTNLIAILHPVDSDGEKGEDQLFPVPQVEYTVLPVSVSGVKTWDDENDRDGLRPESITIRLYANGEEIDSREVTAADGWAWTFDNLQMTHEYKEIVYTISEDAVEGYETVIDGYNVTNVHVPETSEPETSEPETSEPETSEPETSEPETSEPETSEPETSEPETSEPETSEPETSEPETSEPETSEPETSEPETSEPETSEPETSEPETSEPETSEPETSEPETTEPETTEPETTEPETTEPEEIVDDPEVPMAPSVPEDTEEPEEEPETEEEFVEIEEEDVPLAPEAPQTGSNALFAWLVVAAVSGTLFTVDVIRRRRAAADR